MGRDVKVGHRPAPPCWVPHRGPWVKDRSIQCVDDQTQVRPALDREGAVKFREPAGVAQEAGLGREGGRALLAGSVPGQCCGVRVAGGDTDLGPRMSEWGDLNSRGLGEGGGSDRPTSCNQSSWVPPPPRQNTRSWEKAGGVRAQQRGPTKG